MSINFSLANKFFFALMFGIYGCECIGGPHHSFEEKVLFSPEAQYKIGDTIWMTSNFICSGLLDTQTGQTVDYCGVEGLELSLQIFLLEPWSQDTQFPTAAVERFGFLQKEGIMSIRDDTNANAFFQINNEGYNLKIGMIVKQPGQYAVFFGSSSGPYKFPGKSKCDNTASFSFSLENQDNHISLLEIFKKGAQNVTEYEKSQGYCFEVIE